MLILIGDETGLWLHRLPERSTPGAQKSRKIFA